MSSEVKLTDRYLKRVEQFYTQVKNWLGQEQFEFPTVSRTIQDKLGTYQGEIMTIEFKSKPRGECENLQTLADLIPMGVMPLLGEGVIEVTNWLGEQHIIYFPRGGPTLKLPSGDTQTWLTGVTQDGWYWMADPRTREAKLIDKALLLTLITLVSDYEFEST